MWRRTPKWEIPPHETSGALRAWEGDPVEVRSKGVFLCEICPDFCPSSGVQQHHLANTSFLSVRRLPLIQSRLLSVNILSTNQH